MPMARVAPSSGPASPPAPTQAQWPWQAVGEWCSHCSPTVIFEPRLPGRFSILRIQGFKLAVMQRSRRDPTRPQFLNKLITEHLTVLRQHWRGCCCTFYVARRRVTDFAASAVLCTSPRTPPDRCRQASQAKEFVTEQALPPACPRHKLGPNRSHSVVRDAHNSVRWAMLARKDSARPPVAGGRLVFYTIR